jgi:hypothetical protein
MMQRPSTQPGPVHLATAAALTALLVGVTAYGTLRSGGALAFPTGLGLGASGALAGSLPSFVHTFAFALLSAVALGLDRRALVRCAGAWALVGVAFELLQHDRIAAALLPHPATFAPDGATQALVALLARHAHLGVFDVYDVVATLLGAVAAWAFGASALARRARTGRVGR